MTKTLKELDKISKQNREQLILKLRGEKNEGKKIQPVYEINEKIKC